MISDCKPDAAPSRDATDLPALWSKISRAQALVGLQQESLAYSLSSPIVTNPQASRLWSLQHLRSDVVVGRI